MRSLFIILLFTLMPLSLLGQAEGVSSDGKTFRATRTVKFGANVKKSIKIDEPFQFIELGAFQPGEAKRFVAAEKAVFFNINGDPEKEVTVSVKLTIEEAEIKLEEGALEAQLNGLWVEVPCYPDNYAGVSVTYNCDYYLSVSGQRSFRFFPKLVVASTNYSSNENQPDLAGTDPESSDPTLAKAQNTENILLVVQISCEYNGI